MQKKTICCVLCLAVFILGTAVKTGWSQTGDTVDGYQKLSEREDPIILNFLNPYDSFHKYVEPPTLILRSEQPAQRRYSVRVSGIERALNEVGVKEPLSIELLDQWGNHVVELGHFNPKWNLPVYCMVEVPQKTIHKILAFKFKNRQNITSEVPATLVFRNANREERAKVRADMYFPFAYKKEQLQKLDKIMVVKGEEKALKYAKKQKRTLRHETMGIVAQGFLRPQLEKLIDAGQHDEVMGFCKTKDSEYRLYGFKAAGDIYSRGKQYDKAIELYLLSGVQKNANSIGDVYLKKNDFFKAVEYFEKGVPSFNRALTLRKCADFYKKQGNQKGAKKYYLRARDEFEYLLKAPEFQFSDNIFREWHRCRRELAMFKDTPEEKAKKRLLERLLSKADKYCQRLESDMIHFFCKEQIKEQGKTWRGKKIQKTLLYEYQLIRENKELNEYRTLLRYNGKTFNKKDAKLGTSTYQYKQLILGPIGFFAKGWQKHFDYRITGEDMFQGRKALIVQAMPLRTMSRNFVAGRIWVDAEKFSILRIEWEPKYFMSNFSKMLEHAWKENAKLDVAFVSDFDVERNGIRFPSRYFIHEQLIKDNGKKTTEAKIEVQFKDFRFFTVGTDVTYQN